MIPQSIQFTGVSIETSKLLPGFGRKINAPYPSFYTRIEFEIYEFVENIINKINDWLMINLSGNFGSYQVKDTQKIILMFEDASDAILFKLLDGHSAWFTK